MTNRKTLLGLVGALTLVLSQISVASAAPLTGGGSTTCTIRMMTQDSSGNWVITCTDGSTATLTQAQAITTGLLASDGTTQLLFARDSITLDNSLVTKPCAVLGAQSDSSGRTSISISTGGSNQPVADALGAFFCGGSTDGALMIEQFHTDGFGFGEIAQALFVADQLGGDVTAWQILVDKHNHDFTGIALPDGSTPRNWGEIVKTMLAGSMNNLGGIMSGRLQPPTPTSTSTAPSPTNLTTHGNTGNHGGGNGRGNGGGHGKGNPHIP